MEAKIGSTGKRFLFKFAPYCTLCHCCSFLRTKLSHLKTPFSLCDLQRLLLIGKDVTVVRCQGCSGLCSDMGMAICREKRNKMRKEYFVSTTFCFSKLQWWHPALKPRGLISSLKRAGSKCVETLGEERCDELHMAAAAC